MNDNVLNIKRGTTPTIIINIPDTIDMSLIAEVWFSISQDGNTEDPLIKRDRSSINFDISNKRIWLLLTQDETMSFKPTNSKIGWKKNEQTELEVSILLDNGVRATTKRYLVTIQECVREGIMEPSEITVTEPLEDSLILDLDINEVVNINPCNYNELQNKPSINGVELVGDKTSNDLGIVIPTKTSELENDGDGINSFATVNQIPEVPTNISAFNNDTGYITSEDVPIKGIERNGIEQVPDENGIVNIKVPTDTQDLTNNAGFIIAVELTQTQYDMLSPEEKMNGSIYLVRPDDN